VKDGDDLEVELVDAPEPGTRTVELRPRRRSRELLLVLAAVGVVAGVGLVGDGGDEDAQAAPTTTSTRRGVPGTQEQDDARTSTTRRRPPRSTTTRGPTTTVSWPQRTPGTGPILPGEAVGTSVGVINARGQVIVIDLDTGDRCETEPERDGVWAPWSFPTLGRMFVQAGATMQAIDEQCAMTAIEVDGSNTYASTWTEHTVWVMTGDSQQSVYEISIDTGKRTGREVALPRFNGAMVVAIGDDLVLGTAGSMTLVDPDTDERTDLGTGNPLAAHGTRLAFYACPESRCRLGILDIATGERHLLDTIEPVSWDTSVFSPNGRYLRTSVPGEREGEPSPALVDLETGTVRVLESVVYGAQFTPDSQWLIGIENARVIAVKVDGTVPNIEIAPDIRDVQNLSLL
jgi:hypothetical protein